RGSGDGPRSAYDRGTREQRPRADSAPATGTRSGSRARSPWRTDRGPRVSMFRPRTGKAISRGSVSRPMEYPPPVGTVLKQAGASVGDTVAVATRDKRFEGVVMPHHAFSGSDVLTVKLANGVNGGI